MAVGGPQSYFIRGASPRESGVNPIDALSRLWTFWFGNPALRRVNPGNVVLELSIGAQVVRIEITDPALLNDLMQSPTGGPQAVLDYLAKYTGLNDKQGRALLMEAQTDVQVDVIQDPRNPTAWQPGETMTPGGKIIGAPPASEALPSASGRFLGALIREDDKVVRRAPGAPRRARGSELLRQIVEYGQSQGISPQRLSKLTGVAPSTLREAKRRFLAPPPKKELKIFQKRKKGQRLTGRQEAAIRKRLQKNPNAASVARQLGLPERTVRDVRARVKKDASRPVSSGVKRVSLGVKKPGSRARTYTPNDREALLSTMRGTGLTATEAARSLGLPERTARGWARKAKLGL